MRMLFLYFPLVGCQGTCFAKAEKISMLRNRWLLCACHTGCFLSLCTWDCSVKRRLLSVSPLHVSEFTRLREPLSCRCESTRARDHAVVDYPAVHTSEWGTQPTSHTNQITLILTLAGQGGATPIPPDDFLATAPESFAMEKLRMTDAPLKPDIIHFLCLG